MIDRTAARTRALSRILRDIRSSGGTWSDGRQVLTGERLDRYRKRVLDRLINMRAGVDRLAPREAAWNNFCVIARLARKSGGAPDGTAEWLARLLVHGRKLGDPGSLSREPLIRRMLREHFADRFRRLEFDDRYSDREQLWIRSSWESQTAITRVPVIVQGVRVQEGAPGYRESDTHFRVEGHRANGLAVDILIPQGMMVKKRRHAPGTVRPDDPEP